MEKTIREKTWSQEKLDHFEKYNIKAVRPMRIPRKLLEKKVQFYERHNIPYWLENTNDKTVIYASGSWGTHMNKESSFKASELQFIKSVKNHIIKNETYKNVKDTFKNTKKIEKIKYAIYSKKVKPGDRFENCVEIDLKGAYWEQLYRLPGVISHDLYLKGKDVEKQTRLACVGTLAKSTGCISFDGQKHVVEKNIKSESTEFLWNTISYNIGKVMAEAAKIAGSDFIFFWVDAIFVQGDKVNEIIELFKNRGFDSSVHKCEWIEFNDTKIIVGSKEKSRWLTKYKRDKITLPNGKPAIKISKYKVFTEQRPFPYKKIITKKDEKNKNIPA